MILVDVSHNIGFWIFLQEYLRQLPDDKWQTKKKMTIKIPKQNQLSDLTVFLDAIHRADAYMRELHPSSVHASILHRKNSLEQLDPRFNVDISCYKKGVYHHLKPQEDVQFSFQFKNENQALLQRKLSDLLDKGLNVTFTQQEIAVSGSGLLENLFQEAQAKEFTMSVARHEEAQISLYVEDDLGIEYAHLHNIEGTFISGYTETRFSGSTQNSPFKISLGYTSEQIDIEQTISYNF